MPLFKTIRVALVLLIFAAGHKSLAFGEELHFYQTLDNEPAPVLTPEQALSAFRVAPGFEVELVAAEPLVEDPVAMAWDEYGRLYVVEMRGFMPDAYGTGSEKPVGQVVRLEDSDGDGRMDKSEVFLDTLVNPRAVAVVNEGVLIGEPPNLWLCELRQRNSGCENKRRVGEYAAQAGATNVEHMENGLLQGLDNWLYNAKSDRSLRMSAGKLEVREGFSRGQWGITKDNYGRLFYNHNSTWLQVDLFAAEDLVIPGATSYPAGLGFGLTELSEVFSVRVNPGVNRAYLDGTLRDDGRLHKVTAVSGLVAYRGHQFPEKYRNDVFVPEAAGNVVAQFRISERGMALSAQHLLYPDEQWGQREFLGSTDERFRPVDAMNGPDGALYIIDMYRGIVQDSHFLTDELRAQILERQLDKPIGKGRIWRIRHTEGEPRREMPVLAEASDEERVAALAHENGWVRDTAQRLLVASEGDLRPALAELSTGDDSLAAIHAIWTLQGRGELRRELVLKVAARADPQRQLQVLRAGRDALQLEDMSTLNAALAHAPEAVRMQLAFAMGNHAADTVVRSQLQRLLVSDLNSPYVRQAVLRSAQGQELPFAEELLLSDSLEKNSTQGEQLLGDLAASAYRSLRGDLDSEMPANPALLELLDLVQSRRGGAAWQQAAMLKGLGALTSADSFQPARLTSTPPVFSSEDVSDKDFLWEARLAGRRAFTWPGDELALGLKPLSSEQKQLSAKGEAFYAKCAVCHGATGGGTPGLAPPLAGVSWVTGPPEWLGRIILQGMSGPMVVEGTTWNGVMPPHGHLQDLDDEVLAGLMTYLRRSWGNTANPVDVSSVTAIRAASAHREKPWTELELKAVPYHSILERFVGTFSMQFGEATVSEVSGGLHLASEILKTRGLIAPVSDTSYTATIGDQQARIEFIVEDDGSVDKFIMHIQGQQVPFDRVKN